MHYEKSRTSLKRDPKVRGQNIYLLNSISLILSPHPISLLHNHCQASTAQYHYRGPPPRMQLPSRSARSPWSPQSTISTCARMPNSDTTRKLPMTQIDLLEASNMTTTPIIGHNDPQTCMLTQTNMLLCCAIGFRV